MFWQFNFKLETKLKPKYNSTKENHENDDFGRA